MELTISPSVILSVGRCHKCGSYWGTERNKSGTCPVCASETIIKTRDERDALNRTIVALRGVVTRQGKAK